jgi:hypothetical protein
MLMTNNCTSELKGEATVAGESLLTGLSFADRPEFFVHQSLVNSHTAKGPYQKLRPNIPVVHVRHPNVNSRYCGKGGSGARNLGFGEAIPFASFFPAAGVAGGAGDGRTRFCANNAKCCALCASM